MKNWILKKLNFKNRNKMCKTIDIKIENAREAYRKGTKEIREALVNLLGAEHFKSCRNWEEIISFEIACEVEGIDPVKFVKDREVLCYGPDEIAEAKLKVVIRVINEGWKPNYKDGNQRKWSVYLVSDKNGFSLAYALYDDTYASVGSRLVLETEAKTKHMMNHFLNEYKLYLL